MDWLLPSLKATLFPSKSTGDIGNQQPAEESPDLKADGSHSTGALDALSSAGEDKALPVDQAEEEAVDDVVAMRAASTRRTRLRRRSSLSDLDVLKTKNNLRFTVVGPEQEPNASDDSSKPSHRVGSLFLGDYQHSFGLVPLSGNLGAQRGSIGDMINQKLYGSNRSLVSGTSSIAEKVPLETVQTRRVVCQAYTANDDTADDGVEESRDDEDEERRDSVANLMSETDEPCPRRTPSVKERTQRLSNIIRKQQRRTKLHDIVVIA